MSAKVLLPVLVFAVVVLAGIGLLLWNAPPMIPPSLAAVTEFAGIKLGASPSEVTLALGRPDAMTEPSVQHGLTRFDYVYSALDLELVFYGQDRDRARVEFICTKNPSIKLLDIDSYSREEEILQKLGSPDSVSVARDGLSKLVSFKKWRAAFVIEKGSVIQKCATASGSMKFNEELLKPGEIIAKGKSRTKAFTNQKGVGQGTGAETQALGAIEVESRGPLGNIQPKSKDPSVDPQVCAPNLSKDERLSRLAEFGAVQQTSEEAYEAGSHKVQFVLGGLVDCY
jgi:hypothetical protein